MDVSAKPHLIPPSKEGSGVPLVVALSLWSVSLSNCRNVRNVFDTCEKKDCVRK